MNKTVVLGVTGGIAAYKTPWLVRLLVKEGARVRVVMTRNAAQFVTPLTLATVSEHPVHSAMWDTPTEPSMEHITLADQADGIVIAPATANFIAKLAGGLADDLLSTLLLAARCPVMVCPSMNTNMFLHPAVQENLQRLTGRGVLVLMPDSGELACGWTGAGRMPEPDVIADHVLTMMQGRDLEGLSVLVTAGPTVEFLDPVRYLTNRSSGKMGIAIAKRAALRGARVTLVAGPLKAAVPAMVNHIPVQSARDMQQAVLDRFPHTDVVIKAAAVADFRPADTCDVKVKKAHAALTIPLETNPDILLELGAMKRPEQILVGFAAETDNVLEHARAKLLTKNLDMLVVNDVSKPGAGFDVDTNIIRILHRSGEEEQFAIMPKSQVADMLLDRVMTLRQCGVSVSSRPPESVPRG